MEVEDEDEGAGTAVRSPGRVTDDDVVAEMRELVGDIQGLERKVRNPNGAVTLPDLNANLITDLEPNKMVIDSLAIVLYQEISMITAVRMDNNRDTSNS